MTAAGLGEGFSEYQEFLAAADLRNTRTGWHQEGERREDPCGCQRIWCRGRWHPSGLTCSQHWPDDPEAAVVMRRGLDERS